MRFLSILNCFSEVLIQLYAHFEGCSVHNGWIILVVSSIFYPKYQQSIHNKLLILCQTIFTEKNCVAFWFNSTTKHRLETVTSIPLQLKQYFGTALLCYCAHWSVATCNTTSSLIKRCTRCTSQNIQDELLLSKAPLISHSLCPACLCVSENQSALVPLHWNATHSLFFLMV